MRSSVENDAICSREYFTERRVSVVTVEGGSLDQGLFDDQATKAVAYENDNSILKG